MCEYIHKTTIPTESETNCLVFDDALYFSSHTNVYKVDRSVFSIFTSVEGTVRCCAVNGNNMFLCTDDRVYMNYRENTIGSLRLSASAIDANDRVFAVGVNNALEIWEIPREYRFTLFRKQSRSLGHHRPIVAIKIIDGDRVLTASEDNTVRLFNIKEGKSAIVAKTRDAIRGIHLFDGETAAVSSSDGMITFFGLADTSEKQAPVENRIVRQINAGNRICSASSHGDLLAVVVEIPAETVEKIAAEDHFHFKAEPSLVKTEDEARNKVDVDIIKAPHKRPEPSSVLVVYKGEEEIYRAEIGHRVSNICLFRQCLAIRSPTFVGILNIQTEKFTFSMDLPRITNFNTNGELIAATCADRKVRIYSNHSCRAILFDPKSRGDILATFLSQNSCLATYRSGYVSVFNVADSNCYRSFTINGDGLATDFKHAAITDDGCVLFFASDSTMFVVDVQRSKLIDELKLKSPLVGMAFHRDYLYFLDFQNEMTRFNFFNGKSTTLQLEVAAVGFGIRNNTLIVSTASGLVCHDLDFNYLNSISLVLDARHREEVYSKSKPVESLDFDSNFIFCGGQSNQVKIVRQGTHLLGRNLCMNDVVQTLRLSKNRDWENYKEKLGAEKKTPFKKENFIEARKIIADESRFCVLSREGILIFETSKVAFNPIEFDVQASPEFIAASLGAGNFTAALISALRLGDYAHIRGVLARVEDVAFAVKFVPQALVSVLVDCVVSTLKCDYTDLKMLEFIKWVVFYHRQAVPDLLEAIREGCANDYRTLKNNYYMVSNILKKNK